MSLHRRILLSTGSNGPNLPPPLPLLPSSQLPSHVFIAVASFGVVGLLLALVYYAVLRHRHRRPASTPTFSAALDAASDDDSDDHPFWHVTTVGLDDAAIGSIGSYAYRASDRTAADDNCSVCLGEVLESETVRLLPKCGHVFHIQCIDTWLRCHVSCPICRAAVGVAAAPIDGGASSVEGPPSVAEDGRARVSVESFPVAPESSEEEEAAGGALRSVSLDHAIVIRVGVEKEGNSSNRPNCSKDDGFEKGHSESGRGFLFSRLGRARSSSVLPM